MMLMRSLDATDDIVNSSWMSMKTIMAVEEADMAGNASNARLTLTAMRTVNAKSPVNVAMTTKFVVTSTRTTSE